MRDSKLTVTLFFFFFFWSIKISVDWKSYEPQKQRKWGKGRTDEKMSTEVWFLEDRGRAVRGQRGSCRKRAGGTEPTQSRVPTGLGLGGSRYMKDGAENVGLMASFYVEWLDPQVPAFTCFFQATSSLPLTRRRWGVARARLGLSISGWVERADGGQVGNRGSKQRCELWTGGPAARVACRVYRAGNFFFFFLVVVLSIAN